MTEVDQALTTELGCCLMCIVVPGAMSRGGPAAVLNRGRPGPYYCIRLLPYVYRGPWCNE